MLDKSSVPIIEPHYFSCQAWQLYHKENLVIHVTYKILKENSVLEQQHPQFFPNRSNSTKYQVKYHKNFCF